MKATPKRVMARSLFQPAAVGQATGTNAFIVPYGMDYYLVIFWQQTNSTMTMQYAENIVPVGWEFLALYGAVPSAQYVAAAIPARWTASQRLFVRGINEPQPPAFNLFADPVRDIKRSITLPFTDANGKKVYRSYNLFQRGVPDAIPFQVFTLKPNH